MLHQQSLRPYLSIVVPVYNVEKYIEKCVYSILRQSFKNFELILIDDGSTDESGYLCEKYAKTDGRIRIIHQDNAGVSAARNVGIGIAVGQYIAFVDSDDWIEPETYEMAIDFLHRNQLEVVCFDFYEERKNKNYYRPMYDEDKIFNGREAVNEVLKEVLNNSAWDKLYLRRLFDDLRYPNGKVFEDVALTYKILAKSSKTGYLNRPLYHYVKRQDSIIGTSFSAHKRWDRFSFQQERLEFARSMCLDSLEICRARAVRQALSVLTANYIDANLDNQKVEQVCTFISLHGRLLEPQLTSLKTKILFFSNNHFKPVHKIYAYLSYYKKIYFS